MTTECCACGALIDNHTPCYGLTTGQIDPDVEGFYMDEHTGWDVYCAACSEKMTNFIHGVS